MLKYIFSKLVCKIKLFCLEDRFSERDESIKIEKRLPIIHTKIQLNIKIEETLVSSFSGLEEK